MEMMKWIQNREKRITFELDSDNTWRYLSSVHCVQASLKTNGNLCFAQNFGKRSVNDSPGRFHSVIVFFSAVKKKCPFVSAECWWKLHRCWSDSSGASQRLKIISSDLNWIIFLFVIWQLYESKLNFYVPVSKQQTTKLVLI